MECSICYNEITAATGKVELSCLHPFHFTCLTKWFDKQKLSGSNENCPLCRHESTEFEKMPPVLIDDKDDDDSWEYEEPSLDELAAQERARQRFAKYKRINPVEQVELYAANLIKACWRGYQDRIIYRGILSVKEDLEYYKRQIGKYKRGLEKIHIKAKFLKYSAGLTRFEWKTFCALKIQVAWSSYLLRKNATSLLSIRMNRLVILADTTIRVQLSL